MPDKLSWLSYGLNDGIPTMRDSDLAMLYQGLEKTLRWTFFDGSVRSEADFIELAKEPDQIMVVVFRGKEPVMVSWLNHIEGVKAQGHFAMFRAGYGKNSWMVANWMVREYLHLKGQNGEYLFSVVCGLTPVANRLACRFVEKFMPHRVIVPHACKDGWTGEVCDGMFSYKTRCDYVNG